jgi:hypothetical protein
MRSLEFSRQRSKRATSDCPTLAIGRRAIHASCMSTTANWSVTVDTVTDALVRSHLARHPGAELDAVVVEAVGRELDRLALPDDEGRAPASMRHNDMWCITIPRPR